MKFLYRLYLETKNKFVKKYLLTCIVAKMIKDEINIALAEVPKEEKIIRWRPDSFIRGGKNSHYKWVVEKNIYQI